MKQLKRPTRKEKELISSQKIGGIVLNPKNWLVERRAVNEIIVAHRTSGKIRTLKTA